MEKDSQDKNKSEKTQKNKEQKSQSQKEQKTSKELAFEKLEETGVTKGLDKESLYNSLSEDEITALVENISKEEKPSVSAKEAVDLSVSEKRIHSRLEKQKNKEIDQIKKGVISISDHKKQMALQAENVKKLRKQVVDLKKELADLKEDKAESK